MSHYAECLVLLVVMLSAIMLSVVTLSVIVLSVCNVLYYSLQNKRNDCIEILSYT
jgi:hypothetical protein